VTLPRRLRIVHLFPDVLRFYGDGGNVMALVDRAEARSIATSVAQVRVGDVRIPPADLLFIGGGQDREQVTVARELERLGVQLLDLVAGGSALLAVCGGYQNLGTGYRTSLGEDLACPGLLPVSTDASGAHRRLVGPVLANVERDLLSLGRAGGEDDGPASCDPTARPRPNRDRTVVGFENHGGRTTLVADARRFATIEVGHGNNGLDGSEGVLLMPGEGGLRGLRIGTYLHGPLLPRNPHIADALIASALGHGDRPVELAPLDDNLEWAAHRSARAGLRRTARDDRRVPRWVHRALDPIQALIGY
jgi:lipid II isoglutaminyl synthase (glutamine-hydrolysing)